MPVSLVEWHEPQVSEATTVATTVQQSVPSNVVLLARTDRQHQQSTMTKSFLLTNCINLLETKSRSKVSKNDSFFESLASYRSF